uniref:Uncharacterized protein n=1 Tax=Anguilla anguilla TaxID=7936 RepID=A0A0E9VIP6_ANGAN
MNKLVLNNIPFTDSQFCLAKLVKGVTFSN